MTSTTPHKPISLTTVVPSVVPQEHVFNKAKMGLPATREMRWQRFEQNAYSDIQRVMRVKIEPCNIMDLRRGYITLTAACAHAGGTYGRFCNGIWSLIDEIRLIARHGTVHHVTDYALVFSIHWMLTRNPFTDATIGFSLHGIGTQAQRNAWAAGHTYILPLSFGALTDRLLHLSKLGNQSLWLELTTHTANMACESDGVPTYTITNPELCYDELDVGSSITANIRGLTGVHWQIFDWQVYTEVMTTNQLHMEIPDYRECVRGYIVIMRNSADVGNPAINDRAITANWNNLTNIRFRINGKRWPERAFTTAMELYIELLKYAGAYHIEGHFRELETILNVNQLTNNRAYLCFDRSVHLRTHGDTLLNPFHTPEHKTYVEITLAAAPGVPQDVTVIVLHDTLANITHRGQFHVIKGE